MRTIGYIYERVCDKENIKKAIICAAKNKKDRKEVQRILADIDRFVDEIYEMLINETYIPAPYTVARIREGILRKERIIHKPKFFPDQIIHWAIILQLKPIISKSMYEYACGSIPKKGPLWGKKKVEKWIRTDRKNTKYYLKTDITKFYPSVDNELLKKKLRAKLKDERFLNLLVKILDLIPGLPIGILLSQWLAHLYLTDLDHFIKQDLGVVHYIRYADDMVFFGRSKKELHKVRVVLEKELAELGLKINPNWQVSRLDKEPLDFMGFRFHRNWTVLRRKLMLRTTRRIKRVYKKPKPSLKDASGVISSLGWIKHSNSKSLKAKWIDPYIRIKKLKGIIRRESGNGKIRNSTMQNTKRHRYRRYHN